MPSNRRQNRWEIETNVEATLRSWLQDLRWINPDKVKMETDEEGTLHFTLETKEHRYLFSAHKRIGRGVDDRGYLGCIAASKNGKGGNDLPDGPFSYEVWQDIIVNIVGYECADYHG